MRASSKKLRYAPVGGYSNTYRAPRNYSRRAAQLHGRRQQIRHTRINRAFVPGRDRRSGMYGRFGPDGEKKFHDVYVAGVVQAGIDINQITVIPEGVAENQRIGRKITIRNVNVRAILTLPISVAAGSSSDIVKCMIVQDFQTNGTEFTALELLAVDRFTSFRNLANASRFRILATRVVELNVPGAVASGAAYTTTEIVKNFNISLKTNIPIEYDSVLDTGVITTVRSNNLYIVWQSRNGLATVVCDIRLRYSDR